MWDTGGEEGEAVEIAGVAGHVSDGGDEEKGAGRRALDAGRQRLDGGPRIVGGTRRGHGDSRMTCSVILTASAQSGAATVR